MADLSERLRAARLRGPRASEADPEALAPASQAPAGWQWVAPLVAERRLQFSLEPRFWGAVAEGLDPALWDQVLCFDTETTGLSGGAGTVVFLMGWARLVPTAGVPEVEIRQWFLRDHPGEAAFIEAIDTALAVARGLVSFNGATFDLPLLRSRWTLAGRTFPPRPHRDDLYPSRRLWKRILESCRLGRLESSILGLQRLDDVPGALVPTLWFDYLRAGAPDDFEAGLGGVLRHHAQDVYSLLCLDLLLASLRARPERERWSPVFAPPRPHAPVARPTEAGLLHPDLPRAVPLDFWGWLALLDEGAQARRLEEAWTASPSEAVGLAWALRLKRERDPRAALVWEQLWTDQRSYPALEEWLKWLEHRDRRPEARQKALDLVHQATQVPFLPRAWKESLEKRRQRLERSLNAAAP